MNKKNKQKGIIPAILALIIGLVCIPALVLLLAIGGPWLHHIIAGLSGGGEQPGGNCNVGCGFDETKVNFYTHGDAPNVDATSEEAKNFAINTLNVEQSQIVAFDKSQVENMIRAEIAKQWAKLSTEQQHGATQADAQRAILAYQYHEDSSFQMFVNKGGRLVPKHDSTTIQLLSISIDKYQGNKRKEIALNWDIKYTIYTGVKENISAFINNASGSGAERWKQAIAFVFWPSHPNCYWTNPAPPCRSGAANEGWQKYQNEVSYNCQISTRCEGSIYATGNGECAWPIPGANASNIGSGYHQGHRGKSLHRGIDLSYPNGTTVVATMDGTARIVQDRGYKDNSGVYGSTAQNGGYGNRIMLEHANNVYSDYHHLKTGSFLVTPGQPVKRGQKIAEVDNNGWSSGPHLHFQLNHGPNPHNEFDPMPCLGVK